MDLKISSFNNSLGDVIESLCDNKTHSVKISTTKKIIERDRKDARYIKSLNNVKLIYKKEDGGILILMGNLQVSFRQPFGGEFFLRKIIHGTTNFEDVKGVIKDIKFISIGYPTSVGDMQQELDEINNNPDFEYNISQFDEFMEIFEFYKKLSDELNNNISYQINNISRPYYFISSDVQNFESNFKIEVKDQNGVLKGYKVEAIDYQYLKNEIKEQVLELVDIHITGGSDEIQRIKRVRTENVYLSNVFNVSEKDIKSLKQFSIVNIIINKNEVIISGELKNSIDYEDNYEYLNLYDMGQKIKVESIDNSLRLINQGATGSASELLQYLIGDKAMPNDEEAKENNVVKEHYMQGLNESQRRAFLMAVDGQPVSLIKGPPGTGKTHVINAIVQYITKELNEKVIISSQTHIAIDNVLDKLIENYDLIIPNRITNRRNKYSGEYIDETLYKTWGSKFEKHNLRSSNKELAQNMVDAIKNFKGQPKFKYSEETQNIDFKVIGATTTTSAIAGKKGLEILKGYDWLIIDEVSKCPITEVLRYLPYVSKIIMVGDDYQLAPLLEFSKEDVMNLPSYNEELFTKLQRIYEQSVFAKVLDKAKRANRLVQLNENYRSVSQVLTTYNVFYDSTLIGRRETIRPDKCHFKVVDSEINYDNKDVFFVEVSKGQEQRDGTSRFNLDEIQATAFIIDDLMKKAVNPSQISVSAIFPYAAQINHFQKKNIELINKAKKLFKSFEIDTVDAFQGKETDIVLVNTVVTDSSQKNFLNDFRRINVSMSRARDKLIVFGNSITLSKINMKIGDGQERQYFKEIINYIKSTGTYLKYEGGKIENGNKSKSNFKLA